MPANLPTLMSLYLRQGVSLQDYDSRYRQFLKRLRQARLDASLTQEQVAERLGKPQSFISKSENGERRVDALELEAFASLYGKPIDYFLDTDTPPE